MAATQIAPVPRPVGSDTGFENVVAAGVLRGLTFSCAAPITILLDADEGGGAGLALRLLGGVVAPASGRVRVLGGDPAADAALRRDVALLGDDVLLAGDGAEDVADLAAIRGAPAPSLEGRDLRDRAVRRAISDALAAPARARLVLLAHPEDYRDAESRRAVLEQTRAAIERGVPVVIATRVLDEVLAFSPDDRAIAAVIAGGTVVASAPAHALPWALPWDAETTRVVRIVVAEDHDAVPPSARLAASLFADADVGRAIVAAEPVSPTELRVRTRDPRALARSIGARAKEGLAVRALVVLGAPAIELAGGRR